MAITDNIYQDLIMNPEFMPNRLQNLEMFSPVNSVPSRLDTPFQEIPTDGVVRGIYNNIKEEDLIEFACKENIEDSGRKVSKKIVRSFMITRE